MLLRLHFSAADCGLLGRVRTRRTALPLMWDQTSVDYRGARPLCNDDLGCAKYSWHYIPLLILFMTLLMLAAMANAIYCSGCASFWATWKHLALQMFCFPLLPLWIKALFVASCFGFFFCRDYFPRLDVRKSIFTCLCVLPCVMSAQSRASQMERIMTVIRLYRLTLYNERHSRYFIHHQQSLAPGN